jgi:hypothetical protein
MRARAAAFAIILSATALAQDRSRDALLDLLAAAGNEAAAAARGQLDALDPEVRETLAPALAAWIIGFRDAAVERGVEEIPLDIRDAMIGFVPREILDDVRWRVDDSVLSVGQSLLQMGAIRAVTLDDVVLFAGLGEANDPTLWAHELFHVMQYREWGVDGFVTHYLADHRAVEHDASEFRWRWMKATGRVPRQ